MKNGWLLDRKRLWLNMKKFKPAQKDTFKITVTAYQFGDFLRAYADRYQVVDPNGLYEFEYSNIYPYGELGFLQELKLKRIDRAIR